MHSQKSITGNNRRKGIALLVTAAMSVVILPMVGLSVDVGLLYVVKTKLSSATDAAAIAGAETLRRGVDFNAQRDNAIATANNYFTANFPTGYLLTSSASITTTVVTSGLNSRIVTSNASATVPVYFLRFLKNGPPSVTVAASSVATRRDSNVVLVMDRSASLQNSGSCAPMQAAATGFVDKFSEQTDYLGLVTFASTSYYMDYPIATNFKSSSPSISDQIAAINCVGGTSSSMGLWNGYTALANLAQPGALNVLVFFTDGDPTGFAGQFPLKATSGCSNLLKAQAAGVFGVLTYGGSPWGLIKPQITPVSASTENLGELTDPLTGTSTNGCSFYNDPSPTNVTNDIAGLPATGKDYYGNSLATGYQSPVNVTTTTGIQNASINAADDAARRIRNGDVITAISVGAPAAAIGKSLSNVVIFSIGLGNAGTPPNADFLKRVANTADASSYDNTKQSGYYIPVSTAADLDNAFSLVAAEVLRLSQ